MMACLATIYARTRCAALPGAEFHFAFRCAAYRRYAAPLGVALRDATSAARALTLAERRYAPAGGGSPALSAASRCAAPRCAPPHSAAAALRPGAPDASPGGFPVGFPVALLDGILAGFLDAAAGEARRAALSSRAGPARLHRAATNPRAVLARRRPPISSETRRGLSGCGLQAGVLQRDHLFGLCAFLRQISFPARGGNAASASAKNAC